MSGIRDIATLAPVYCSSGKRILKEFLLPVLSASKSYDRITGYFTTDAFLATAQGLEHLYLSNGTMRLAVGIHDFPKDAAQAITDAKQLEARIAVLRAELVRGVAHLGDTLLKDRIATLALMIEDGFLKVRVADTEDGQGIFHSKMLICRDESGDAVAAMGSVNETSSGLGANVENLMVVRSWTDPEAVDMQEQMFESAWEGTYPGIITLDLTHELAQDIIAGLGEDYVRQARLRLKQRAKLSAAINMPSYFFVSGIIPALYQHQECAVIDGLNRWPVRVLFADEVGLGKTFEAAATITFLIRFCGAKRAVILTPKSVLSQWQEELHERFGIDAWYYDSAHTRYISPSGKIRPVRDDCPLGQDMPPVALISAQYARGSSNRQDIFSREGTVLPDILAVDEAHAARVSLDIDGRKHTTTRLYDMLQRVAQKIPHLILATATPMQRDAIEYHSLLRLLGMPGRWGREKAFLLSLSIIGSSEVPSLNDLANGATLLLDVAHEMKPSLDMLDQEERRLLGELDAEPSLFARGALAQEHWHTFIRLFIKLHPAHLLTVRNTRRSLEGIGYQFPKRVLSVKTLYGHDDVRTFYDKVNDYIGGSYFGVERALHPSRTLSDGFVKSCYQQRISSSLHSCDESLRRRRKKLEALRDALTEKGAKSESFAFDLSTEDEDDALLSGEDSIELDIDLTAVDCSQVILALNTELVSLDSLQAQLASIQKTAGDPKVDTAIDAALKYIASGDQVLLFSRYADTVDALVTRWETQTDGTMAFGIYTGSQASIRHNGISRDTTKDEIKTLLRKGFLKAVLCSDAASEGLNLQAARVLINVDVPWTPARLEQRIGRVARLGQKASSVEIVNIWYPQSVEERMYRRIGQRLSEYNLAVGEFPEIVADSIRQSVLYDTDDKSHELLDEMRDSLQTNALRSLWSPDSEEATISQSFRQGLLDAIASAGPCERIDAQTMRITLADGKHELLSSTQGSEETVTLSSRSLIERFPHVEGCTVVDDPDGHPCVFRFQRAIVDAERLPDLLIKHGENVTTNTALRPRWLPDPSLLSIEYAIEQPPPRPRLWPPTSEGPQ